MEPLLKKQRFDYFDPYSEDLLTNDIYNHVLTTLFINTLCRDVIDDIFQNLSKKELIRCAAIAKNWYVMINHRFAPLRALIYEKSFTPQDCSSFFEIRKPTQEEIKKAFRSIRLDINPNEYTFSWAPQGVTLSLLEKILIKRGLQASFDKAVINKYGSLEIIESSWTIVARNLIPESRDKTFKQQLDLIHALNQETKVQHKYPTFLKTAIHLVTHYIKFDHLLLDSFTTRCEESGVIECNCPSVIAVSMEITGLKIKQDCYPMGYGMAAIL